MDEVAWMKRSALARLDNALRDFRTRGGTTSVIIGIDEGGATRQGLQRALDLFDQVYIYHDPSSRTYHPKLYLALGSTEAVLVVGSNNMTAGGLYSNYEAALLCYLDMAVEEDQTLITQVIAWFDIFPADSEVCKQLTPELLEALLRDPNSNP
jgi:HKD family nuclease